MTVYTPPANNAVNFELESYTPPVNTAVSFELLDSIQSITGASFTDPDSFGTGVVTATAAITGAGFTDGDSFGTGVVTSTASITGVGFSDADTFGAGTVSSLGGVQNITGVGFSLTNSFGAGDIFYDKQPFPSPIQWDVPELVRNKKYNPKLKFASLDEIEENKKLKKLEEDFLIANSISRVLDLFYDN